MKQKLRKSFSRVHINKEIWQYKVGKSNVAIYSPTNDQYIVDHSTITGRSWNTIERSRYKNRTYEIYSCGYVPDHCITPSIVKDYIVRNIAK